MANEHDSIIDNTDTGEIEHATVKSTLAMTIDMFEPEKVSLGQVARHMKMLNEDQDNIERKKSGEMVANYYFGRLQLQELKESMQSKFPDTWESKDLQAENFTKSVSRQISQMYKSAPTRKALYVRGAPATNEAALVEQNEIIDLIYKRGQINKSMQEIERMAKWSRSVLCRVMYQMDDAKIFIKPYSPQFWDVMVSESGKLQAVIISDYFDNPRNATAMKNRRFWVWTADEIAMFKGSKMRPVGSPQKNPIGIIPFVLFNDELPVENEKPYLHPDTLMANTNLMINTLLTDGMSLSTYQTYGQPYVIGGEPDDLPETTGHNEFLHFQHSKNEAHSTEVGILQPAGDFDGLMKFMERIANGYGTTRGLASNAFSAERNMATSGVALKINNHSLIEMFQSEEAKYQGLETEVFPIVRALHNLAAGAPNGHNLPVLRDDIELKADFTRTDDAFESTAEVQRQALTEVQQGLLKVTDFIKLRFPSLSDEEALQYATEAKKQMEQLGLSMTIEDFDNMLDNEESQDGLPEELTAA